MQHCVILGDVVDSRSIENRAAFRDELIGTLTHVNSTYEDQIHTPFETIKGIDEIGGVLSSVRPSQRSSGISADACSRNRYVSRRSSATLTSRVTRSATSMVLHWSDQMSASRSCGLQD